MKGKIDFFQKCIAFLPCQLGMRTSSLEGVFTVQTFSINRDITIGAIKGNNNTYCLTVDKIVCNV